MTTNVLGIAVGILIALLCGAAVAGILYMIRSRRQRFSGSSHIGGSYYIQHDVERTDNADSKLTTQHPKALAVPDRLSHNSALLERTYSAPTRPRLVDGRRPLVRAQESSRWRDTATSSIVPTHSKSVTANRQEPHNRSNPTPAPRKSESAALTNRHSFTTARAGANPENLDLSFFGTLQRHDPISRPDSSVTSLIFSPTTPAGSAPPSAPFGAQLLRISPPMGKSLNAPLASAVTDLVFSEADEVEVRESVLFSPEAEGGGWKRGRE
ncbi:hypothetical protein HDU67_004720 [Dinochytrium kinnereticum]|nr:hypothetical protein HDU67_004720 [Dinochytrium kinnereticum]